MSPTNLDPARVSPRLARAGQRLHEQGRTLRLHDGELWFVEGDTLDRDGNRVLYMVGYEPTFGMACTCPAHGPCKHIQAVRAARKETT